MRPRPLKKLRTRMRVEPYVRNRVINGRQLREICTRCGLSWGQHGATPPYDRGDECAGFKFDEAAEVKE